MRSTRNISNVEYDEDILCKTFTKSYAPTAKCSWTHLNDMNCNTSKCKEITFQKKNNTTQGTTQGHPTTAFCKMSFRGSRFGLQFSGYLRTAKKLV